MPKPGGALALLKFSRVAARFVPFFVLHSRFVIPLLGPLVAGDKVSNEYLAQSIGIFPDAALVSDELRRAGLWAESTRNSLLAVAALHLARKP